MTAAEPPVTVDQASTLAGADALTDQARWLIDYHTKTADGLQQRAMGFLGVVGVLLGLVLTALTVGNAPDHNLVRIFTILTVVALVSSSVAFVKCLWITTVATPGVEQTRAHWRSFASRNITSARVSMLIANDYLAEPDQAGHQPLTAARAEAKYRAKWLRRGLRVLVIAFVLLACLIVTILFQQTGGDSHGRGTTHPGSSSATASRSAGPVR